MLKAEQGIPPEVLQALKSIPFHLDGYAGLCCACGTWQCMSHDGRLASSCRGPQHHLLCALAQAYRATCGSVHAFTCYLAVIVPTITTLCAPLQALLRS